MRLGVALALTALASAVSASATARAQDYSAWPDAERRDIGKPPARPAARLEVLFRLGTEDGPETTTFGFVPDVGLGSDGRVYVLDQRMQRVAIFDSAGAFVRWFGRTGAGPGEFLSPFKIVVIDTVVAVYDQRQHRVSLFDTAGTFRSSFPAPVPILTGLAAGPNGTLVAASPFQPTKLFQFDLSGKLLRQLVQAPKIERRIRGNYLPDPGASCTLPNGRLIYASSWIYEIAALDLGRAAPAWRRSGRNDALRPADPDIPGVSPVVQGGVVLGLECMAGRFMLAYLARRSGELYYDFFDAAGALLGRLEFIRSETGEFPGFLGAVSGNRVAAYRTKPYSQVSVYRVAWR